MHITDALNVLTLYFLENTNLKFSEIDKLIPKDYKKDKEGAKAAIIGALNSPEMLELLQTVTPIPNDINSLVYVLKKPLYFNKQSVEICGTLGIQIAQIVNSFIDSDANQCNPLNINENDIRMLLNIINLLSDNQEVKNSEPNKIK